MNYKACPFCGSMKLRQLEITLADDDGERDVTAIECLDCDAQAPERIWNERAIPGESGWQEQLAIDQGNDAPAILAL